MGCNSSSPATNPSSKGKKPTAAGNKPIVTLTGVTGYIGSMVCKLFLEDGNYRVRGTVRDKTNEAKLAPLKEAFGDLYNQLELVNADLNDE